MVKEQPPVKDGALSKEELEKYMATSPGRHQCGMQGLEWLVLFHDLGMILSQCPALSRWEIEEFPQELERVRNLERDRFAQIACVLRSTCRYRLPLSCDVAPCPGRVQEKFKLADADGDGKLQGEETRLARCLFLHMHALAVSAASHPESLSPEAQSRNA